MTRPTSGDQRAIRMTVTVTEHDARRAMVSHPMIRWVLWLAGVAVVLLAVVTVLDHDYGFLPLLLMIILVFLPAGLLYFQPRKIVRNMHQPCEWTLTEHDLYTKASLGEGRVSWSAFRKITGRPSVIILQLSGGAVFILPRRFFAAEDLRDIERWFLAAGIKISGKIAPSGIDRSV